MEYPEATLPMLLAVDMPRYFPAVIARFQQRLFAFALRLTGSRQDAEDIVQEAFIGAYVSLENYAPPRIQSLQLQAWLYKVTLNVYNHHTRAARLHVVPLIAAAENVALEMAEAEDERPEVWVERQEQRHELTALVAQLPERYRVAVTCYYFAHLSYQEIADLLDQPVGTVKSTIHRGVRQLRMLITTQPSLAKEEQAWNPMTAHPQQG